MGQILLPADLRLAEFREATHDYKLSLERDLAKYVWGRGSRRVDGYRSVGGGAPTPMVTLAAMRAPLTKNTITGPNSILDLSNRGPFSPDWFNAQGAMWEQEAMGVLSSTATPTIIFRSAFGTATADPLATSLANSKTFTTVSGAATLPWYFLMMGRTATASGATSTMRCHGFLINQIETAAAGNNTSFLPASGTAPSDVTTDLTGNVYLDIQVTWSASSVSNQTITELYVLKSLMY